MSRFGGGGFIGKEITMKFIMLIYVLTSRKTHVFRSFFLRYITTSLPTITKWQVLIFCDNIRILLLFLSKFNELKVSIL